MNRVTKLGAILSNLIALGLLARLVSRGFPQIFFPTVAAFVLSTVAAAVWGEIVPGILLSFAYLVPAACFAWFHNFIFSYSAIWLAGLCGSMLPRAAGSKWAFPGRWSAPLVFWALVLACSWPIIVLREVDFVPTLLSPAGMGDSRLPQSPAIIIVWILSVTSIALTGLLLFDWLFLTYSSDGLKRFEAAVIWPMFAGAAIAGGVAFYQSVVDPSFLNQTFFQEIGRAVGTMRDANAFGAVVAMWLPVAVASAIATNRRLPVPFAWLGLVIIFFIAVWASGSRTALLAAGIGVATVTVQVWRSVGLRRIIPALVVMVVVTGAIVELVPSTTWARARGMVPELSRAHLTLAVRQLWSRDLYGTAAMQMIVEHPLVGVGIGGFNYQYGDVLYRMSRAERPPDNAQNWYRQQLAELGVIGSLGWIIWLALFLWMVVRRSDSVGSRAMVGAATGAIFGLASASMLGMPTQDAAASITFIVFAFWCMKLRAADAPAAISLRPARLEWVLISVALAVFLVATLHAARNELRPPQRAARIDFPYRYGFMTDPGTPGIRWTGAKAVEVFPADKRWLKVVIGQVAPDAAARPVQVRVWANDEPILRVSRLSDFPIERWVRMPAYGTPVMIQIQVDRTWRASDYGISRDDRQRGVAVHDWLFSDEDPPKGSVTFDASNRSSR